MLKEAPFDPLIFLERQLRLKVCQSKDGTRFVLDGFGALSEEKRRQARWVLRNYNKLLQLQIDAPKGMRPSVHKLLAQGRLRIRNGRYVLG